ncbi:MAG: UbiX family flavin prenyltransferase [Phycisphaerales bacterium JB038]
MNRPQRIIVGITGASGALYARRVLQLLYMAGVEIHLVVSTPGKRLLADELGITDRDPLTLLGLPGATKPERNGEGTGRIVLHDEEMHPGNPDRLVVHDNRDIGASIASGSFEHDGMIIVPCSSNTLGTIAAGIGQNLLTRAAAVALKERRPLVLCHRETPTSLIDARNIVTVIEAGAIVAPANPGLYLKPTRVEQIVDFLAGRWLDLLGVEHDLPVRWDEYLETLKK